MRSIFRWFGAHFRGDATSAFVWAGACVLALVIPSNCVWGQTNPVILWPQPAPIQILTPLTAVQLDATAIAGQPEAVPLAGVFNVTGITTLGFSGASTFDGSGQTYPAELLGSSISWRGVSFPLGAANTANAVSSATIPLPAGSFGRVLMLGALVNNHQPPTGAFEVLYTDGSSTTLTQSLSDWVFPENFTGESVVECLPYRYTQGKSIELDSVCVYGYSIDLDPTKTVVSLTLPNDRNIVMLAFAMVPAEVSGTLGYNPPSGTLLPSGNTVLNASFTPASGTGGVTGTVPLLVNAPVPPVKATIAWPTPQSIVYGTPLGPAQLDASASVTVPPSPVPLEAEVRTLAIAEDGFGTNLFGFDGAGNGYSSEELGTALSFAGGTFPLGESRVPDAVTSTTIPLPSGSFDTVYLLGAANGAQLNQSFTVHYTDGSSSSTTQSLSDWRTPQNFAGEAVVATTSHAVTSSGGTLAGTFDVYGYRIPVNVAKTAASVTLPQNSNVEFLAAGVGMSGTSATVTGTFAYTPAAGTILTAGIEPLNAAFTPVDGVDYADVEAVNSILVAKAPVTLSVSSPVSSLLQGQSVTLTAGVLSTTIGVPTGTVTFVVNGTVLGTASLSQGTANLTTTTLPQGVDAISISYSGDVDFLSASTGGPTLNVLVSDFTLAADHGTTLTVPWGSEATLSLHVAPLGPVYESNLSFTAGALGTPFGAVSISPGIVGQLAGPNDVGVTVKLDRLAGLAVPLQRSGPGGPVLAGLAVMLLVPFAARRRLRRGLRSSAVLLVVVAGLGIALSGCGSGYYPTSVPLTVTATDGTHTHSVTLTVRLIGPQ